MFSRILYVLVLVLLFFKPANVFSQPDSTQVVFSFTASEGYLVINENYSDCIPIKDGQQIVLGGEINSYRIVSKYYQDSRLIPPLRPNVPHRMIINQVKIKKLKKNAHRSSYARCFWDSNVFVITEPDAKVSIDGEELSHTAFRTKLSEGSYTLSSIVEGRRKEQDLNVDKITFIRNFIRHKKKTIYFRSLVPGLSQLTKNETGKAFLLAGVFTALGANTLVYNYKIADRTKYYQQLKFRYKASKDPEIILALIKESENVYNKISRYEKIRNMSLIGLSAVYLVNIWDGIQAPDLGFRKEEINFNPYIDFDKDLVPKINLKVSF